MTITLRYPLQVAAALSFTICFTACAPESKIATSPSTESVIDYNDGQERLPDDETSEIATSQNDDEAQILASSFKTPSYSSSQKASILSQYDHLDPKKLINTGLLAKAVLYYHANQANLKKKNLMTVLDYSLSSKESRMFIINMTTGAVVPSRMAHGKGSDANHDGYAEKFSNVSGSNASSIGPYLTAETYYGGNGYSLRLDGLGNTNSRARARAIVLHGSSYVQDRSVIQGRSWGCPAVPMATRTTIINTLKGGSLIYAGLSKSLSSTP